MDLRALRYFIAVLEAGSLSRAAGSLFVAQPALTAQIKKLEAELGAQLFERSHAGVAPTPAGLQLYQDARRLLSDAAAMRERIQRLPLGPEGSVTVAVPFLLASLLMGPVLTALKQSHPRVRVFVLDDLSLMVRKAMLDRRADVAILVDTPHVEGLRCRPFAREAIFLCGRDDGGTVARLLRKPPAPRGRRGRAAPARSGYAEIDFAVAAAQPLVLQSRRFSIRQSVEGAAAALGVPLNIVHEHDSARVIRSLYLSGAGFTFSPACALGDSPGGSDWLVARVTRPELPRSYTLATVADKPVDALTQVVIDALLTQAKSLIEAGRWEAEWRSRD
ncbi:LysR family transcriptional regulator [Ramlibacter sp. WS9]|uniref:LysR family transcriptional regulator n=1 Tax=Ramlibacter sp. WS9 TaxID=1882741 RepID=UPI001141C398|nr:LysR family transcriptional regulator [Ramlibacter sp. WS9]ROZ71285.1 LysR family transcriptional regulator [Ramlibacter sp. WS9]